MTFKCREKRREYQREWRRKKKADPNWKPYSTSKDYQRAVLIYRQLMRLAFPENIKRVRSEKQIESNKKWKLENPEKQKAYKRKSAYKKKYGKLYEVAMLNTDLRRLLCQEKQKVEKH